MKKLSTILVGIFAALVYSFMVSADHNTAEALQKRTAAIGELNIVETGASTAAAGSAPEDGETVYQTACMACHAAGVAGAPKVGDISAWTARIEQGMEMLVEHAVNGFQGEAGMMPPKGGNTALSDDAVSAAVQFMVDQSQ